MTDYNKIDHTHCFDQCHPPCGQKIKHFKCCLCEMEPPDVTQERNRCVEVLEGIFGKQCVDYDRDCITCTVWKEWNEAITKIKKL